MPNLFVSVNVSTKQFASSRLIDCVQESLAESGLDPDCLKLEITESAIMTDPKAAAETLNKLRTLGVSISLDDFGTGYSSLSYLQTFPIDTLKIDRSFIKRLGSSNESDEIVRTIVNLAHSLGMEVTAEGIEEPSQRAHLTNLACESGQGFLYSRPMSDINVEQLLMELAGPPRLPLVPIAPMPALGEVLPILQLNPWIRRNAATVKQLPDRMRQRGLATDRGRSDVTSLGRSRSFGLAAVVPEWACWLLMLTLRANGRRRQPTSATAMLRRRPASTLYVRPSPLSVQRGQRE